METDGLSLSTAVLKCLCSTTNIFSFLLVEVVEEAEVDVEVEVEEEVEEVEGEGDNAVMAMMYSFMESE